MSGWQERAEKSANVESAVKHQIHHSYIWLGSLRIVAIILFATAVSMGSSFIGVMVEGFSSPDDLWIALVVFALCGVAVLILVICVVVYQVVSYKHLWYELSAEEFNLYSGIFSKKRVHVPYRRIQSVDQRASLIQRIFGVCTVSIDTAGGSNNKAIQVPYVRKSQAEHLWAELFMRKQGELARTAAPSGSNVLDASAELWDSVRGVFAGDEVETGAVSYEHGLTNKELVLTGLSNNTAFVLIIVGVLGLIAQVIGSVVPLLFGEAAPVVDFALSAGMRLFGGSIIAAVAVGAVGLMVVMWLLSAVASCISYGGFRCRRRGDRIEVERGLLQHQFQGVNIDRVQSITVRQTFIRRLFGYCEVSLGKIDAVADGGDSQQATSVQSGLVVHPFVKMNRVPEILAGLVPEFSDVPVDMRPVPRVARRRAIVRRAVLFGSGFWLALCVAIFQIAVNAGVSAFGAGDAELAMLAKVTNAVAVALYALAFFLAVLDVVGAVLWYRDSGFAFNRAFMQVSNGGLSRETVSLPRRKIQFGYTRTNPFQRRVGTATLNIRTAAGVGGTTLKLIDAREDDAAEWLAWLEPHGNLSPMQGVETHR